MKNPIKRHFLFMITEVKYSRTYGGCDYSFRVVENKGRGRIEWLEVSGRACTRGHRGEESEAWRALMGNAKIKRAAARAGISTNDYFDRWDAEKKGWKLEQIGRGI